MGNSSSLQPPLSNALVHLMYLLLSCSSQHPLYVALAHTTCLKISTTLYTASAR